MRNIFKKNSGWVRLQQGALFSGAISESLDDSQGIFGLIITPRCDLSNKKVSTVHYLPVIPFKIWKYNVLAQIYQNTEYDKFTKIINKFCEDNNVSPTLFDVKYNFAIPDIEKSISHIRGYKDILNKFQERSKLANLTYCQQKIKVWAKGKDKIKDLLENKHSHYYMIEDWRDGNKYLVIMLREVKRLELSFAEKMEKGISEKILAETDDYKNDIRRSLNKTEIYKFQQVIDSPYLEHIMESFSKNFCRIGIDRIDESILNNLIDE